MDRLIQMDDFAQILGEIDRTIIESRFSQLESFLARHNADPFIHSLLCFQDLGAGTTYVLAERIEAERLIEDGACTLIEAISRWPAITFELGRCRCTDTEETKFEWATYENSDPRADLEKALQKDIHAARGSFLRPVIQDFRDRLLGEEPVDATDKEN
jgi:hypothetical protein